MEYTTRKRYTVKQQDNVLLELYPHDIQFYNKKPTGEVSLKDFQDLGLERKQVLQSVESTMQRADLKSVEERKATLLNSLRKDGFNYSVRLLNGLGCSSHTDMELQARRRDHVSHYILRLAYCQNMELRRWFVNMEVEYLKLRFSSLNKEGILKLMALNDFDYTPISQEEKDNVRESLYASTAKITAIENIDFYKVPFRRVSDLIRGRRVYVERGSAYVPQSELVSLFVSQFKISLDKQLEIAANNLKNLEEDDRLSSFLKTLPMVFSGMTRAVWSTTAVPIESLDELSKISYPVCMRSLHEALKAEHHLKNSGRMQYGLFIKGIGVTLEDALRFWRTEFTKKIDLEKFEKTYTYDIRHYYGKVGNRKNYTPYGCSKIITSAVGHGENHGCPYKHMSNDTLKQRLASYGLPPSAVSEIAHLAKDGHYNLACTKCFEATHKTLPERPIVHPNMYFAQSRDIIAKSMEITQTDNIGTPSGHRRTGTPTASRNIGTPTGAPISAAGTPTGSRNIGTPKRIKIEPLNIEELLNDDQLDEAMAQIP